MTNRINVLAVLLSLFFTGCVCSAAKEQVTVSAGACDTYANLIESTLDGSIPSQDGQPVTPEELAKTPDSVKALLQNCVTAIYTCRRSLHKLAFAISDGPDPAELDLDTVPQIK